MVCIVEYEILYISNSIYKLYFYNYLGVYSWIGEIKGLRKLRLNEKFLFLVMFFRVWKFFRILFYLFKVREVFFFIFYYKVLLSWLFLFILYLGKYEFYFWSFWFNKSCGVIFNFGKLRKCYERWII